MTTNYTPHFLTNSDGVEMAPVFADLGGKYAVLEQVECPDCNVTEESCGTCYGEGEVLLVEPIGEDNAMNEKLSLIAKMVGQKEWRLVLNPVWQEPFCEYFAAKILENFPVEYVEYVNSGAVYRVVREAVLGAYVKEGDRS